MNTIEEMEHYIAAARISEGVREEYGLMINSALEIRCSCTPLEAIAFAFRYGCAKGYQAAMEQRKEGLKYE